MQLLGLIFVLLAGLGFGFLGVFGKLAFNSGLSVGELLTYRFILASLIFWVTVLTFKARIAFVERKVILSSILLGVLGYAVFSSLYFKSIEGISVALAALLLFTFPLFVNIGAHFFLKERMHKRQVMSLILASIGLVILLWGPIVVDSFSAVLYAMGASVTYAIYVLVSAKIQKNVNPFSSSLYVITAAAVALTLVHQPDLAKIIDLSRHQKLVILGIALISTIGPLTLFLAGLQRLPSSTASIVVMIEPVVAAIAAWIILDEKLTALQTFGAVLVIGALFLNAFKKKKN